jgi:hypothetical protein
LGKENIIEEIEVTNIHGSNMYEDCLHTELNDQLYFINLLLNGTWESQKQLERINSAMEPVKFYQT